MSEFQGAGQKPGLEIWRIEKMVPTPWEDVGKFCTGDSYIVLKTSSRPGLNSFEWDIHFWLGTETSQDEAGVAAYKTVELDDLLGGAPVQHREVQGHESDKFLSYFKGGIEYIEGGVDSGFTKVVRDQYDTRLLHCKGATTIRVNQVPVSYTSLNTGDVFILDCGLTIYHWNGKGANKKEKAKGLDVTTSIRNNERGGRAKVIVLDEGEETEEFWAAIGGQGPIAPGTTDSDAQFEKSSQDQLVVYRVSDASGTLEVETAGTHPLKKAMLDTKDVFIVDGGSELFVWIGKGATHQERKNGMIIAQQFITKYNKPSFTKVTRVIEGAETAIFKDNFSDWHDMRAPVDFTRSTTLSRIAQTKSQTQIDVDGLLNSNRSSTEALADDGSGKLDIWRINNFEKEEVPRDIYGQFYAGDSYIILYTYKQGSKENYIIYFWQGRDSTADEKGTAAILATKLDDQLHGAAVQVRVIQGKEPTHFLSLFKGKMIIHSGGTASGFKNKNDADSYDTDGVSLFHIKGTNSVNTRAVQVTEVASSLNSGDAFLLKCPETVYVWFGLGCNEEEQNAARTLAALVKDANVSKTITEVKEGEEPEQFWEYLGGKVEYATSKELVEAPRDPRLFHLSNATGVIKIEEVFNYSQDDLDDSDVFLLDLWAEVLVWVGSQANTEEKKQGATLGLQFVERSGRPSDTPVHVVHAGFEPQMFTSAFLGWDANKAETFEDPYAKRLRLLQEKQAKAPACAPLVALRATKSMFLNNVPDFDSEPAATEPAALAESTPTESTPTESTPTESTPTESTPAESVPAESSQNDSTPAESTPTDASTDAAATESAPTPTPTPTPVATPAAATPAVAKTEEPKAVVKEQPLPKPAAKTPEPLAKPATLARKVDAPPKNLQDLLVKSQSMPVLATKALASIEYLDPTTNSFGYTELKNKTAIGINPAIRELYLSDAEFEKHFRMTKAKYLDLRDWRKMELRKQTGMF